MAASAIRPARQRSQVYRRFIVNEHADPSLIFYYFDSSNHLSITALCLLQNNK